MVKMAQSRIVYDEDVSNATVTPIIQHNSDNTLSRFHSSKEVYELLLSATPNVILQDVLRGRKENCFFVVDNTQNALRKLSNQKNRFCDDCGVWDSKRSRNLTSIFVKLPTGETRYTLQCVEQREGNYCVKRRLNKKVAWDPLQPQPAQVNVVLFEYVGTASEVKAAHGASRRTSDPKFVRMHPRVLDKICVALEHREKPNQVYHQNVLSGNSFDLPRNVKQVRNLGQAVRSNEPNKASVRHIKNIADDMMTIINGIQNNNFIQSVVCPRVSRQ